MALPLTGYKKDDLILIETEQLYVSIKGLAVHPRVGALSKGEPVSKLSISCVDPAQIEISGHKCADDAFLQSSGGFYREILRWSVNCPPLFFETQNYEIVIHSKGNGEPGFWHENALIRNKITPIGRDKSILSGMINFGNEIGYSDFSISLNGEPYLTIQVEVFPTKLDYQQDYLHLMQDVTDQIYNLAFDFLRKTYLQANINHHVSNSDTEFFSIIRLIYQKFMSSIDIILSHPHHVLQVHQQIMPAYKIRQVNQQTVRWLLKHPEQMQSEDCREDCVGFASQDFQVNRALGVVKKLSFDTLENRFVKFMLLSAVQRLKTVQKNYTRLFRETDQDIINQIQSMIMGINRRISYTFLNEVGNMSTMQSLSLVFAMAPGYSEVFRYYQMLLKGLSLDSGVFKISTKDVASLYEYWCFIKLNSMLRQQYNLVSQDVIKTNYGGLFLTLQKGSPSQVQYENPKNGERITLSYNPLAINLPTVSQKPDNVLSLSKQGSNVKYQYVFDAKYRMNPAVEGSDYHLQYGQPGPEVDDINTMHRYRDAMVYTSGKDHRSFERFLFGAYVLFPYSDEENYKNHTFYKSIDKVNIGGLPFLPSATGLVQGLLDELIKDSSDSAFERATLPLGIEKKLLHIDLSVRDVLVGTVRSRDQFKACFDKSFYYIPVENVAEYRLPIRYIAIYQSIQIFEQAEAGVYYYGEVTTTSVRQRKSITEMPASHDLSKLYYYFEVKSWLPLKKPIKAGRSGPVRNIYTNSFLLQSSSDMAELLIQSKDEWRLYHELKRIFSAIKIEEGDNVIKGFEFQGNKVVFHAKDVSVHTCDGRYAIFQLDEYRNNPRLLVKEVISVIGADLNIRCLVSRR